MSNIHHAEMTYLVRREKELERDLEQLRDQFATWKERIELAEDAGRAELAEKARDKITSLRAEGRQIRNELQSIVKQKKNLRRESRRPTGEETRRAEALLESFRQSGLVDPEEAQMKRELEDAAADAELDEFKKQAAGDQQATDQPDVEPTSDEEGGVDAELAALKQKAGVDDGNEVDDEQLDEQVDDIEAELDALRDKMSDEEE